MKNNTPTDFKKEFPYKDTYFDTLSQELWNKIDAKNVGSSQKQFYNRHKYTLISSLSVCILLLSAFGVYRVFEFKMLSPSSSITLNKNINISKDSSLNIAQIKQISTTNINTNINIAEESEINLENISQSDLENYLVNQDLDLSLYFE